MGISVEKVGEPRVRLLIGTEEIWLTMDEAKDLKMKLILALPSSRRQPEFVDLHVDRLGLLSYRCACD